MIVDDSITVRTVLARLLADDENLQVVASVSTAELALAELEKTAVDVILLDLEMPGMGGLKAIPEIIAASRGGRVLVVSALTVDGAEQTVTALSLGAADTFPKPTASMFDPVYRQNLLARVREIGRRGRARVVRSVPQHDAVAQPRVLGTRKIKALAIGASTGGIHALSQFLRVLPLDLDIPILVTQHLPPAFMTVLARQLTLVAQRPALVAEESMEIRNRQIYIAPGDGHLCVRNADGKLWAHIDRSPVANGCMPSVDPMFASLSASLGGRMIGVVLSGMGKDGLEGAREIIAEGGSVYAQDAASCAVWGMPRAVTEAGLASVILPPDQLGSRIAAMVGAG